MTVPLRRAVRLTVRTPSSDVDLEITDDAIGAEVVRLVAAAPEDRDGTGGTDGWELVHPRLGPIPLDALVSDPVAPLGDGDVLLLRPRRPSLVGPPVDDVAGLARAHSDDGRGRWCVIAALLAVLLPAAVASGVRSAGGDARVLAISALVGALTIPVLMRDRPGLQASAYAGVVAAVCGATVLASGHARTVPLFAACLAAAVSGAAGMVTAGGRWWRPWTLAAACAAALFALAHGARTVVGAHEPALTAVAVVLLAACATPLSLATSGLARLDDRVAAGDDVTESEVDGAVTGAGDDLMAVLLVVGAATALLAVPLSAAGIAGAALALAVCASVALRARSVVRARHAVPLAVGGALGAVLVVVAGVTAHNARAVPLLVGALVVALTILATTPSGQQLTPVARGRLRRIAEVAEKTLVISIPLLLAAVFDLYRVVWERF